jgi:tetratricopeptide (TPR) repeat protein
LLVTGRTANGDRTAEEIDSGGSQISGTVDNPRQGLFGNIEQREQFLVPVIANQYLAGSERIRVYDEAIDEAVKATEIAPEFAAGFNALGYALFYGRLDVKGARKPYDRAYALAKSNIDVFSRFAIYCARTGRFGEAYQAIDRAASLDPLNASVFRSKGIIKYAGGQYEEAIRSARQALKINPKRNSVNGDIGRAYLAMGELDKASEAFARESNDMITLPSQAIISIRTGDDATARQYLDRLIAEYGDNGLYQQAQIWAQWRDADKTFSTLKQALDARDSGLVYLLNDPLLDPVRKDPQFKALLLQLGFI